MHEAEAPEGTLTANIASETTESDPFDFGAVGDTVNHQWHPTNPSTGQEVMNVTFIVAGEDTPLYRTVVAEAQQKQAKRAARKGDNSFDAFSMDVSVGVLLEWSGVRWGGQPLECTEKNKRMLFTERRWLYDQFKEFVGSREARMGKS